VTAACTAVHRALPRRGLAEIPQLALVEVPDLRAGLACANGLPVFAAPMTSSTATIASIRELLAIWHTGVVTAPPRLVELLNDRRGEPAEGGALALRTPDHLAPDAALVSLLVAGSAATLFEARVGTRTFALSGRIHDDGETRIVTVPMGEVSIEVRRAGLDQDPGWIPWLSRSLRIVFD
jgi:hypothetical protein